MAAAGVTGVLPRMCLRLHMHIAATDSSAIRQWVEHLSGQPSVAPARTCIVFDYHRSGVVESFQQHISVSRHGRVAASSSDEDPGSADRAR